MAPPYRRTGRVGAGPACTWRWAVEGVHHHHPPPPITGYSPGRGEEERTVATTPPPPPPDWTGLGHHHHPVARAGTGGQDPTGGTGPVLDPTGQDRDRKRHQSGGKSKRTLLVAIGRPGALQQVDPTRWSLRRSQLQFHPHLNSCPPVRGLKKDTVSLRDHPEITQREREREHTIYI